MRLDVVLLCVVAGGCVRAGSALGPEGPCLASDLAPGDRVRFVPVPEAEPSARQRFQPDKPHFGPL